MLTMAPDPADRWRPVPVLVTDPAGMAHCRGMRMGYAPLLALLEPARQKGFKRLAVIGIPCQVYALRALEQELGFERLYVIGTPCSDNTTTERFHQFLALLADDPDTITYLEFRADYHVELRFRDGRKKEIPFLQLPISKIAAGLLSADLPHLRRLHQRAGGHHRWLHGRRGRAVGAGPQRAWRGTSCEYWAMRSARRNRAAPASAKVRSPGS